MPYGRGVFETLLLALFGMARGIFVLQGLAVAAATAAAYALTASDFPDWLRDAMVATLTASAVLVGAAVAMTIVRRSDVAGESDIQPTWPWPIVLGLSLLVLAIFAALASADLLTLWSQIGVWLEAIGFWDEWNRGGANSGLLMLPLLLALLVPLLVSAAALYSILFPVLLLPSVAQRSRLFPTLLAMGVICQAALVVSGWLLVWTLSRAGEPLHASMTASGDAEVLSITTDLRGATAILEQVATWLVAPLVALLAWSIFLRPSGRAAQYFAGGAASSEAPVARTEAAQLPASLSPLEPATDREWEAPFAAPPESPQPPPVPSARPALLRLGFLIPGGLMLLFAASDALRTRPAYASSQPPAGATLATAPASIRITFEAPLDPASAIYLTKLGDAGEPVARPIQIGTRVAPGDPSLRTLEAVPASLPNGLYHVAWSALPAGGGVSRHGSLSFGVGVLVPADTAGQVYSLQDTDSGSRGKRSTIAAGLLLMMLGLLLPRLTATSRLRE